MYPLCVRKTQALHSSKVALRMRGRWWVGDPRRQSAHGAADGMQDAPAPDTVAVYNPHVGMEVRRAQVQQFSMEYAGRSLGEGGKMAEM
jgi:hypothetical protein